MTSAEMESVAASDVALSRQDADRVREISRRHGVDRACASSARRLGARRGQGAISTSCVAFGPGRGFRDLMDSLRGGRGGPRSEGRRGGRRRAERVHQGARAGGRPWLCEGRSAVPGPPPRGDRAHPALRAGRRGALPRRTCGRRTPSSGTCQVLGRSGEEGFGRDPLTRIREIPWKDIAGMRDRVVHDCKRGTDEAPRLAPVATRRLRRLLERLVPRERSHREEDDREPGKGRRDRRRRTPRDTRRPRRAVVRRWAIASPEACWKKAPPRPGPHAREAPRPWPSRAAGRRRRGRRACSRCTRPSRSPRPRGRRAPSAARWITSGPDSRAAAIVSAKSDTASLRALGHRARRGGSRAA